MSMTGVVADPACKTAFEEMKMKHTKRFITYKIENQKTIIIDQEGAKEKTYADFVKALPENEPRYAVVDVDFETDDGRPQSKIAFIFWSPDSGGVKPKMLYASSKDALKKTISGYAKELQCNDTSDVSEGEVVANLKK